MMYKRKDGKPLQLADALRDLALLRVSGLDTSALLPSTPASSNDAPDPVDDSVEKSYLFVQEARTIMKVHSRADVAIQGGRVEDIRNKLDGLLAGVQPTD